MLEADAVLAAAEGAAGSSVRCSELLGVEVPQAIFFSNCRKALLDQWADCRFQQVNVSARSAKFTYGGLNRSF